MIAARLEDRFWAKVLIVPFADCWEWIGAKNDTGYGKISVGSRDNRKEHRAHRFSWEIKFGPIPTGQVVCHKCDNPGCVRPEHLFLGTKKDNSRDMIKKKRGRGHFTRGALDKRSNGGKWLAAKTNCPAGHPYSEANTFRRRGRRECRTCIRERTRKQREKRRNDNANHELSGTESY